MPPSQLKRLKASLRDQGIVGPQKSKKEKKNNRFNADERAKKNAALASIREAANPFDFKHLARPKKFEYATNRPQDDKKILGRPGVTKSLGEETRRKTLLPEMNRRNKVGGILDRRIGEDDPSMSLEERNRMRFEREQQRMRSGGGNVFDLEDDEEVVLTHGGKKLDLDEDYDAASIAGSENSDDAFLRRKRRRNSEEVENSMNGEEEPAEEQPERKRSKKEIMEEVIAKSKQYKYERQQQKEDDEDLREELDKDLPAVLAALMGHAANKKPEPPKEEPKEDFTINPDRAALLAGKPREKADKEYDARVREMMYDARSKPTERTKTEEEIAKENAQRLKELEEQRMRRMRGEESEEEEDVKGKKGKKAEEEDEDEDMESIHDDAAEFGFTSAPLPAAAQGSRPEGVEDEDDFIMDDDLVATDSEADITDVSDDESVVDDTMAVDEDDEFLKDVLPDRPVEQKKAVNNILTISAEPSSKLAYTYPCPRTHEELLKIYEPLAPKDMPLVTQRIRALYHAGLRAENKDKLADFGCALVDHIKYLADKTPATDLTVVETLTRHIHSLARSYPVQIATRFREHLKRIQEANDPTPGDLALFTAISTIFPTSDKFSPVVTPAITIIARFLGLSTPSSAKDIATGAYLGQLCYERYFPLSKRYMPELVRYTILCLKSPHTTSTLTAAHTRNILALAYLWSATPAFIEIFTPILSPLASLNQKPAVQRLKVMLQNAKLHRRPQELHHHRPLPIKSSIPKFEEGFDPNKHYDPDKDRAEAARLAKEYKREKKGALRELRKDANFIAREKLKEKKERDRKYEEKYKRLVAEIQGEEGREKNAYEREKRARQRKG